MEASQMGQINILQNGVIATRALRLSGLRIVFTN